MTRSPAVAAVAAAAQHAVEAWLRVYAGTPEVATRSGEDWFAVRTGVANNEMNAVVSAAGADLPAPLVAELVRWFGAIPASWFTAHADPGLTQTLVAVGARPERTGSWSAGAIDHVIDETARQTRPGLEVVRVTVESELEVWLGLATQCGWIETSADVDARRRLHLAVGLEHPHLSHWLGLDQGRPVGFASSHLDGSTGDLCNLGVLAEHRRRGVGRSLVQARLAHAATRGATTAVSAPSTDGWRLQSPWGSPASRSCLTPASTSPGGAELTARGASRDRQRGLHRGRGGRPVRSSGSPRPRRPARHRCPRSARGGRVPAGRAQRPREW